MKHTAALLALLLAAYAAGAGAAGGDLEERLAAAEQVYRSEGPDAAMPAFEALAAESEQTDNLHAQATATRFVGEIHWRRGDLDAAAEWLARALALAREAGDDALTLKVRNVQGLLAWDLGDYEAATDAFEEAGDLAAEIGDPRMQGAVLNNRALVRDELGEYRQAMADYRHVLTLYEGADFPRGEGDTLGNLGGTHLLLGQFREALAYYERALAISEQIESTTAISQDSGNIALCLLGLGHAEQALAHLDRAIALAEETGLAQEAAIWTRARANALLRLGRFDQGLALHREAVARFRESGAQTDAVEALHDLASIHLALGDIVSAREGFEESMALAREIGLARGVTLNVLALGDLHARGENWAEAEALYRQAWERAREAGENALAGESLVRLAAAERTQGRAEDATEHADAALALARELGAAHLEAEARYELGELAREAGRLDEAQNHYTAALAAAPGATDPGLAWRAHYGAGQAHAAASDVVAAIGEHQQAIRAIEVVRDRITEQRFRAGYVQDKFQVYVDLVRLQMRAGRPEEAFSTAERLRARAYLDLVERDVGPEAALAGDPEEIELRERIRQLRAVLNEEQSLPAAERRPPAIGVYSEELAAAERAYEALLDDRARLPRRGRLAGAPTYADVRPRLGPREALVEYLVDEDAVVMFVLTGEELLALSAPMGRQRLASRVELLRDLIRQPENDRWQRPAESLADALLTPLETSGALRGIEHLYVVPHGVLNYLPFALLPTGEADAGPLLERFTLTYLPTAAALAEPAGAVGPGAAVLAVAPARARLRHAPAEAGAVFELFEPPSRLLTGNAATETLFKRVAGDYDVLHVATHGVFNKQNPMLSGLELEPDARNDGRLELHEILGLQLDADLVTLSACETGLGSGHFTEIPAGDDFVGLTRAFLSAGSDTVMATLWEVDDESTADLMRGFYRAFRDASGHANGAAALRAAQRQLRQQTATQHPYYWAPFVLMGTGGADREKGLGA